MIKVLITGLVNKAFGNMCCEMSLGGYKNDYRICDIADSIKETLANG